VYFDGATPPYGSMAEQTVVSGDRLIEAPAGADVAVAAALGNAGLAAWLPLSWRAALRDVAPRGVDVIVDYLWGSVGAAALPVAALGARLVQVGTVAGDELPLSGELLRSRSIDVLGFVSFRAPANVRAETYQHLVTLAAKGDLEVGIERYALASVAAAWSHRPKTTATRPVLMME